MGKDTRLWRKLVKKLRRARMRQSNAENFKNVLDRSSENKGITDHESVQELMELEEEKRWHNLEEEAWLERERQSNIAFHAKKQKAEELAQAIAAEKERIRADWEMKQRVEDAERAKIEQIAKENEQKQVMMKYKCSFKEEDFNKLLDFLSGDIETPPLQFLMPDCTPGGDEDEVCLYFSRTGSCRFFERCKKPHPNPVLSNTILISNFFTHISLDQNRLDDTDSGLEFEETELQQEFNAFYDDVLPEFRKSGTVMQFKVCRNLEPHLRGNVYVQYRSIQESLHAYRKFNGRLYNGRQLTLRFVKLVSWRNAICGQFIRGCCLKGKSCNYLHVFRDPTKEFLSANRDWDEPVWFRKPSSSMGDSHDSSRRIERSMSSQRQRYSVDRKSARSKSRKVGSNSTSRRRSRSRSRNKSVRVNKLESSPGRPSSTAKMKHTRSRNLSPSHSTSREPRRQSRSRKSSKSSKKDRKKKKKKKSSKRQ